MSVDEVKNTSVSSSQTTEADQPRLNEIQQPGYETTKAVFAEVIRLGYIDPSKIRRILDFGAGLGGPTFGIIDAMRQNSPHVDAIEKEEIWVNILKKLRILPPENIIHADGLSYLEHLDQNGIPPYDLITAFSIGRDGWGEYLEE